MYLVKDMRLTTREAFIFTVAFLWNSSLSLLYVVRLRECMLYLLYVHTYVYVHKLPVASCRLPALKACVQYMCVLATYAHTSDSTIYTNIYCNLTDCARREPKLERGTFCLTATMFLKILSCTYKHINVRLEYVYVRYVYTWVFTNKSNLLGKQNKQSSWASKHLSTK